MVESVLIGIESFINKYLKTSPFIIFQCVFCSLCNLIVVGVGVLRREDGGGGGGGGCGFSIKRCVGIPKFLIWRVLLNGNGW